MKAPNINKSILLIIEKERIIINVRSSARGPARSYASGPARSSAAVRRVVLPAARRVARSSARGPARSSACGPARSTDRGPARSSAPSGILTTWQKRVHTWYIHVIDNAICQACH